ncbi:MAG: SMC-Scp complex subunit ScpB [Firmicutes bacterium]|nr:SMC-Scp complex subunit ScpB [Candidatus Colivicinus equi]
MINENIEEVVEDVEETKEEIETENQEIVAEEQGTAIDEQVQTEAVVDDKEKSNIIEREEVKEPTNIEAIVEGLLYIVGEDGVKLEQIATTIEKSLEDTKIILENIQHKYASEVFGIELVGYGSVYKFVSKKDVYPYAQKLFQTTKTNALSQAALETLAIIAYKQPITRVEIEELRGVGAEMMLRKLQARNLIREVGRSEAPGKPILYEVTEEFMDSFKLYTLNELPDLPEFSKPEQEENLFE